MRTEQPGVNAFTELSDVPHTYATFGGDTLVVKLTEDGIEFTPAGPGGATAWGTITGTLSAQTDLQTALDGKVDENVAIVGATATKITYDAKGLVTASAAATTADINDSTNRRYVTDAQLTVIGNTSGTNTGDNAVNSLYSGLATSKQDTLVSGTNIKTVNGSTLLGSGDLSVTGVTNLSYTAATRVIASDTGTDATLPLVSSGDAGLAPASGGGTSNFLRADGTWAAPAGGSGLTALQVFSAVSIRM